MFTLLKSDCVVNTEMVTDLLNAVGLEKTDSECMFYCSDSEKDVRVVIGGNKLSDVLHWIKEYYYEMGYRYGKKAGRRDKESEIRKVLGIEQ